MKKEWSCMIFVVAVVFALSLFQTGQAQSSAGEKMKIELRQRAETGPFIQFPEEPEPKAEPRTEAKAATPRGTTGVVVMHFNQICLINPASQTVTGPFLKGQLNWSQYGDAFDVVLTTDGKLAIVSIFGDSTVYFISLQNASNPVLLGSVELPFFAEDIALTPDNKYALVTDGGFSSRIASIHVPSRTLVQDLDTAGVYSNAVTVASDGRTVLTADYWAAFVNVFLLDPATGMLTYVERIGTLPYRPINVAVSPNGKTAIMATFGDSTNGIAGNPCLFRINSPGDISYMGHVNLPAALNGGQSVIFSRNGLKAYYLTSSSPGGQQYVRVLNITGPGWATLSPAAIAIPKHFGSSSLFGVDTLAVDPKGNYLYVGNKTVYGGKDALVIIDLATNTVSKVIENLSSIQLDMPTGVAFCGATSDLGVKMTVDNWTPAKGSVVTFTITVTNWGPDTTKAVQILDKLPSGLSFVSANASGGSYNPANGVWYVNSLWKGGQKETLTIQAKVMQTGSITNTAWEKSQFNADPIDTNDKDVVTVTGQ